MRKPILIALGSAAGILLLFVLGLMFARMTAPRDPAMSSAPTDQPVAPDAAPDAPPVLGVEAKPMDAPEASDVQSQLLALQAALQQSAGHLRKASTDNKGGFVEKSRADVDAALADVSEAFSYVQSHPETGRQPTLVSTITIPNNPTRPGGGRAAPNVQKALNSLRTAHDALQKTMGGDLGGYRAKIEDDLKQAASDIVSAIELVSG